MLGRWRLEGYLWLHSSFNLSLGYMRPFPKNKIRKNSGFDKLSENSFHAWTRLIIPFLVAINCLQFLTRQNLQVTASSSASIIIQSILFTSVSINLSKPLVCKCFPRPSRTALPVSLQILRHVLLEIKIIGCRNLCFNMCSRKFDNEVFF